MYKRQVSNALAGSSLSSRIQAKITGSFNHETYMTEGVLDTKGFSDHVAAEVADWESRLKLDEHAIVQGLGTSSRDIMGEDGGDNEAAEDKTVDHLLGLAGQTVN